MLSGCVQPVCCGRSIPLYQSGAAIAGSVQAAKERHRCTVADDKRRFTILAQMPAVETADAVAVHVVLMLLVTVS